MAFPDPQAATQPSSSWAPDFFDPSNYTYNPYQGSYGAWTAKDGSGSYAGSPQDYQSYFGLSDPGTNVVAPDGSVQNYAAGTNPVFPDVGNSAPIGLSPQDAYDWYANQVNSNQTNFLAAAAGLIGGPLLAGALSGTGAAASGAGDIGAAGGAGSGSVVGGGAGTVLTPYEAAGGSIYGSGAAGGLGDSIIATGGNALGAIGTGLGTAGAGSMIDPSLAQDVYGGNPTGAIPDVTVPAGTSYLPSTIPTTPLDPNATMQPFPSPPAGLPTGNVPPPGGSGTGNVNVPPPAASTVPDWLKYLVPGIDALGQYEAASKSSQAQADALNAALAEQQREFDLTRGDYAPYLAAGTNALGQLSNPAANFAASPDYAFRKSEGTKGVLNGYNAAGGAFSGNALRALDQYNSNLASGEFGNWWNRQAGLAGIGQTATSGATQAGQNNVNNQGNLLGQLGDARGTGIAGQWGAVGGLANNLFKYLYPKG